MPPLARLEPKHCSPGRPIHHTLLAPRRAAPRARSFALCPLPFVPSRRLDLLAINLQRLHRRPVRHREQDTVLGRVVLMAMPAPRRHDENVPLLPLQTLVPGYRHTLALECLEDGRAVVAVAPAAELGPQQLDFAAERGQGRP